MGIEATPASQPAPLPLVWGVLSHMGCRPGQASPAPPGSCEPGPSNHRPPLPASNAMSLPKLKRPGHKLFRRRRLGVTTEERRLCLSAIAEHGSDTHQQEFAYGQAMRAFRIWKRTWRALTKPLCDPYRPEQHYMRGPSPKYRAQGIECNVKTPGSTGTTGVNRYSSRPSARKLLTRSSKTATGRMFICRRI